MDRLVQLFVILRQNSLLVFLRRKDLIVVKGLDYFVVLNISLTLMLLLGLHIILAHVLLIHRLQNQVVCHGWDYRLVELSLLRSGIYLDVAG